MTSAIRFPALAALVLACGLAGTAAAQKKEPPGPANVVGAAATRNLDGSYDIRVTVRSADKGADYFADRVELLADDGAVLFTIRILNPHHKQQPFSVTSKGVMLPEGTERVTLRARMRPGGAFGKERVLKLPVKKK